MSSLSTDAGDVRPENFHIENLGSTDWKTQHFKDGVMTSETAAYRLLSPATEIDIYSGRDIPDFHRRKNAGELLPFTKYIKCTHSLEATGRFDLTKYVTGGHDWTNRRVNLSGNFQNALLLFNGADGLPYDWGLLTAVEKARTDRGIDPYLLVQRAASKINGRGFDALTFLAELHKTAKMVYDACFHFANLVEQFENYLDTFIYSRSPNYLTAKTFQLWLQGRYGWRILGYEIENINEMIAKIGDKERTRSSELEESNFQWDVDLTTYGNQTTYSSTYTDIRHIEVGVRGRIITDYVPPGLQFNPFLTAWELVPYSFVFDWLFHVGRAINALTTIAFSSVYTACWSVETNVTRTGRLSIIPKLGAVYAAYQTVDQKYQVIERHPTTVPILPIFQNLIDNDKLKQLDIIALLYTLGDQLARAISRRLTKS